MRRLSDAALWLLVLPITVATFLWIVGKAHGCVWGMRWSQQR